MGRAKFSLQFDGFLDLAAQVDSLQEGALKRATEAALKATDAYVTKEIEKAMNSSPYNFNRTGRTKRTLDREISVEWEGTKAIAKAGFHLPEGLPARYLTAKGHPHIAPDVNLRNAMYGEGKHKKAIRQLQAGAFNAVIERVMKDD